MNKLLLAVTVSALTATAADATVLLGNLPGNDALSTLGIDGSRNKALGFTMGAVGFTADSAIFRLNGSNATARLSIYSDAGNNPGTELAVFDTVSVNGLGAYTFTNSVPFTFAAGTTYWLEMTATLGSFDMRADNVGIDPSTAFATYIGTRFDTNGAPATGFSSTISSFQLDGTSVDDVPEPAMLGLFGMGAIGLGLSRRRKAA